MAYYLLIDDEQIGPLEIEAVAAMIERGEVSQATMVWTAGMDDWAPAGEVSELADMLGGTSRPAATSQDVDTVQSPWPSPAPTGPPSAPDGVDRPLDIGLAFNSAFQGFARQPGAAFLVALVYNLISSGILVLVFGAAAVFDVTEEANSSTESLLRFSLLGLVAMMVVMPILYGGLSIAMLNLVRGKPVQLGQLFGGIPRAVTLVIFWLIYAAGCAVGLMAFILPAVFVAVTFTLTPYVIVESQLGTVDSMKAGFRAVMGLGWWRCFLLLAALLMGILVAGALVQVLALGFGGALLGFVLTLAVNSVVTVVMAASLAAAYEQARANQERANAATAT